LLAISLVFEWADCSFPICAALLQRSVSGEELALLRTALPES
jgi:hypothetical protein